MTGSLRNDRVEENLFVKRANNKRIDRERKKGLRTHPHYINYLPSLSVSLMIKTVKKGDDKDIMIRYVEKHSNCIEQRDRKSQHVNTDASTASNGH